MKAVIVNSPRNINIQDIDIPSYGPYEALVKMDLVAICSSTDTKIKDGKFPGINKYPTTIGHEGIGKVVSIGEKVRTFKIGDRIINPMTMQTGVKGLESSWGTFAEYALAGDYAAMKADGVCDNKHGYYDEFITQKVIPSDIPTEQAILLSTWREVYSSFSEFNLSKEKSLLVIGGGPVGLSFISLAKCLDISTVCLATRSEWKLKKATLLGADKVFVADRNLISKCKDFLPNGFDIVIDAVGNMSVINQALQIICFNGLSGVYGTVSEENIQLNKQSAPYNWRLIFHQWPDYKKEADAHESICEFIRAGKISSEEFITHRLPFEDIKEGFNLIDKNKALKVILKFNNSD